MNTTKHPKTYQTNAQIGRARHSVSFHDGEKEHGDGSRFFDTRIFKNKTGLNRFVSELKEQGYTYSLK